ncbi:MAG: cell wall-binding repeat-containing protein [Egibacteraceae bacterium]
MMRSRQAMIAGLVAANTMVIVAGLLLLVRGSAPGVAGRPAVLGQTSPTIRQTQSSNAAISVAFSEAAYPKGSVSTAVLARDDTWIDALASSGLQGSIGAPLLVTPPEQLAPEVRGELKRIGTRNVYLMGGPSGLSPAVERALVDDGYQVERIPGDDAIANATALAGRFLPNAKTALLVRGITGSADESRGFVDVLAGGAWAASGSMPVLLTDPFQLSVQTREYLERSNVQKVILVGGRIALGGSVTAELKRLGVEVQRISGPSRFDTAAKIAALRATDPKDPSVLLVDGSGERLWVAAFAAALYSTRAAAPILLTDHDVLPPATDVVLKQFPARPVCGPGVSDLACAAARTEAEKALNSRVRFPG